MNAQPSQLALRLAALRASKHIASHELQLRSVPTASPKTANEVASEAAEQDCVADMQASYDREANNKLIITLYVRCVIIGKMPFFTFRDSYYQHWHKDICTNAAEQFLDCTAADYDCERLSPVLYRIVERCTAWEIQWLANDMNISYRIAIRYVYELFAHRMPPSWTTSIPLIRD